MKKIFNWTFGGFFRAIGRTLAFLLLGALITLIAYKNDIKISKILGIEYVSAATVNYSSVQYRAYWYEYGYSTQSGGSSYTPAGTSINTEGDGRTVKLVYSIPTIINFGNNTLVAGRKYKVTLTYTLSPNDTRFSEFISRDTQFTISGSTNGTTWNDGSIEEFTSSIKANCETCVRNSATFYVTPNTNINYIRIIMRIPKNDRSLDTFDRNKAYVWDSVNLPAGDFIKVTYTNDETAQAVQDLSQTIIDINTQIINAQDQTNQLINDDNIPDGQNQANSFFNNFTTNTHGLTGIITAPLNTIQSLSSSTCTPLVLPLPFVNQNLTLPCMRQIYDDNFGSFMNIYDVVTLGIISYWIMVRIFALVKDFKNPDHDEIEVMDL